MRRNILFDFILFYSYFVEEQKKPLWRNKKASGFFFNIAFLLPNKLGLLFDLPDFYKGINMHVYKREPMSKIFLEFLKPLTIFA